LRAPGWPGYLAPTILRGAGDGTAPPVTLAHVSRRLEEVRELARCDALLTLRAREEQLLPPSGELPLERDDQLESLGCDDARGVRGVHGHLGCGAHGPGLS